MTLLKNLLRPIASLEVARPLRMYYYRHYKFPPIHEHYSSMNSAEVFSDIYAKKQWGDEEDQKFTSGSGSRAAYASPYCELIDSFIRKHKIKTVVDLGCGDFRVGRGIARPEISYIGVDVVQDLIAHNARTFGADHIRFQVADLTSGALPDGDLCLIRQVLQHLSNNEILMALERCEKYPYIVITEHLPNGRRIKPNLDKPHGPDIRLYSNSGVFIDQPPFAQKAAKLLDVPVDKWSILRTSLIEHSE
jgi:SAM-dependent methyltransferase